MGENLVPAAADVRRLYSYDPSTGLLTWRHGARAGGIPGTKRKGGYIQMNLAGRKYRAHRLIWLYVTGEWPKGEIDHINGDPADNRILNLRDVPNVINQQNRRRALAGNRAGLLGVTARKVGYKASIWADGKDYYLGMFQSADEAHAAYVGAKRQLHAGCTL